MEVERKKNLEEIAADRRGCSGGDLELVQTPGLLTTTIGDSAAGTTGGRRSSHYSCLCTEASLTQCCSFLSKSLSTRFDFVVFFLQTRGLFCMPRLPLRGTLHPLQAS